MARPWTSATASSTIGSLGRAMWAQQTIGHLPAPSSAYGWRSRDDRWLALRESRQSPFRALWMSVPSGVAHPVKAGAPTTMMMRFMRSFPRALRRRARDLPLDRVNQPIQGCVQLAVALGVFAVALDTLSSCAAKSAFTPSMRLPKIGLQVGRHVVELPQHEPVAQCN